jgi:hypothetical protein
MSRCLQASGVTFVRDDDQQPIRWRNRPRRSGENIAQESSVAADAPDNDVAQALA